MEDVAIPFHIRAGREGRDREEKWCIADVRDPSKLVEASELEYHTSSSTQLSAEARSLASAVLYCHHSNFQPYPRRDAPVPPRTGGGMVWLMLQVT